MRETKYKNIIIRIGFFFLMTILISCDNSFNAKKILSEKQTNGAIYETYLINSLSYSSTDNDSILLFFARKRIKEILVANTTVNELGFVFFENNSCTRGYFANYKHLKNVESIIERCEEDYWETLSYLRSESNPNIWYLTYPENIKDTITLNEK